MFLMKMKSIGKGPNGTLSMIFDGIKKLNKGEKHLKINDGGRNYFSKSEIVSPTDIGSLGS
jgi:hypothetical protein